MKDSNGRSNSHYYRQIENYYTVRLGVGEKYLAKRVLDNIAITADEPPMFTRALDLYFLPLFREESPEVVTKIHYLRSQEQKELHEWHQKKQIKQGEK